MPFCINQIFLLTASVPPQQTRVSLLFATVLPDKHAFYTTEVCVYLRVFPFATLCACNPIPLQDWSCLIYQINQNSSDATS